MSDDPGFVSILSGTATPWMRAIEKTSGERWDALDVDIIRRARDPWTCPAHLLNFLAFERSVDIWDEDWSELKKRAVIASAPADHRIKGTEAGLRRYVQIADAEVVSILVPPQALYLGSNGTKAELDAYARLMPEIIVFLGNETGTADVGLFADDGFFDVDCFTLDAGPALYGRRAVLRRDGVDTSMRVVTVTERTLTGSAINFERVLIPGDGGTGFFFGDHFDDRFFDGEAQAATIVSYKLDSTYQHTESTIWLSTLAPGLEPVTPRYERRSDIGDGTAAMLWSASFLDDDFLEPDRGRYLLGDRLRLFDPAVAAPKGQGDSFWDDARYGAASYTAEVMIRAERRSSDTEFFLDATFLGDGCLEPQYLDHVDLAMDASVSSKAARDKLLLTFQTTRARTLADGIPLDRSFHFGARVDRTL